MNNELDTLLQGFNMQFIHLPQYDILNNATDRGYFYHLQSGLIDTVNAPTYITSQAGEHWESIDLFILLTIIINKLAYLQFLHFL
jgi:hypothetical protein